MWSDPKETEGFVIITEETYNAKRSISDVWQCSEHASENGHNFWLLLCMKKLFQMYLK